MAPSHCSRCYYRRSALKGFQSHWKQTRTIHARTTSLYLADRDKKRQKISCAERRVKIPPWSIFYSWANAWNIRDYHRIYLRVRGLFVLSQLWGGSCNLNCFIYMLKAALMKKWEERAVCAETFQWSVWTKQRQNWDVTLKGWGGERGRLQPHFSYSWSFFFFYVTQICALQSQWLCVNFIP